MKYNFFRSLQRRGGHCVEYFRSGDVLYCTMSSVKVYNLRMFKQCDQFLYYTHVFHFLFLEADLLVVVVLDKLLQLLDIADRLQVVLDVF